MNKYILLIVLLISTGTAFAKGSVITKKTYPNISKDAIFHASKILFSLSNKENKNNDFIINSYRDNIIVEKVVFQNSIIRVDLMLDTWILEVHEFENESRAILSIKRTDAVDFDDKKEINNNVYKLFWDRLDYLLGINTTWESCSSYFTSDFNSLNCYNYLLTNKPDDNKIIKNILISEKRNNANTIDNIKADIFLDTDLKINKSNNILDVNEDILNSNILNPIMENTILETKAIKIVKKKEEKETVENSNVKEEIQNSDESIDEFKDNMKDIVNMKSSLNDKEIDKIITESNNLKENSEFSLETN